MVCIHKSNNNHDKYQTLNKIKWNTHTYYSHRKKGPMLNKKLI